MKNSNYKVSVCISVHNTEKLLRRCLDSVVSQTLNDLEIILVNNGSTDSSLDIMLEYFDRYPNTIKVYSQEDKGLAQGRQSGVALANGEYIAFLDADDYVENDAYEKMYTSAITHNVDIIECCTLRNNKVIKSNYQGLYDTSKILKDYFLNGEIPPMIWMRLYRRSLFDQPVFPEMYVNNEDIFAFPVLLYRAKKIYFLNEQLHYYTTDNENSVMNVVKRKTGDENKTINNRVKTLYVIKHIEEKIGRNNIELSISNEFKFYIARVILDFCLNTFKTVEPEYCINLAIDKTEAELREIEKCYREIKYSNRLIQKSVNILGLKKTIYLYRIFYKLKGIIA